MIEIKNLTKTYKLNKKQMKESRTTNPIKTAVNDLTLTARKGEIYGLLGPNGAGKTTTLRCISTIIRPTKGVKPEKLKERKEELFTYFGIKDFAHKKMKELSTGMGQKAAIAVSLVHDPDIVIFDEPTNGLDVVTARSVTDYLKRLKEEGKLVIISTHIMSEAEKLCDRIGVIIDGRKVMEGHLEDILRETQTEDLEDAFFELYSQVKGGGEDA